jgi:hypothetical protein
MAGQNQFRVQQTEFNDPSQSRCTAWPGAVHKQSSFGISSRRAKSFEGAYSNKAIPWHLSPSARNLAARDTTGSAGCRGDLLSYISCIAGLEPVEWNKWI